MKTVDTKKTHWDETRVPKGGNKNTFLKPAIQLSVPLIVAGGFFLLGKAILSYVIVGIAILLLLCQRLKPSWHQAIMSRLVRLGHWLSHLLSITVLTVIYYLLFAPVALFARLTGRDKLNLRNGTQADSYWFDTSKNDNRRVFDRPFLVERVESGQTSTISKFLRMGKSLAYVSVTLMILNWAIGYSYHRLTWGKSSTDPRAGQEVYQNKVWASEFFRETMESQKTSYVPFLGWARDDYQGQYINVINGHRKTHSTTLKRKPLRVYAFGGSTMWGSGARDEFTIASHLVKMAEEDGIALEVTNFGESGYVNWQNVSALATKCANGESPDLAIFYEGVNDVFTKMQKPEFDRSHMNLEDFSSRQRRQSHPTDMPPQMVDWLRAHSLAHIVGRKLQSTTLANAHQLDDPDFRKRIATEVVDTYRENSQFVDQLASSCGFRTAFFWQPVLCTRSAPTEAEGGYQNEYADLYTSVYHAATAEAQTHSFSYDLSQCVDNVEETVYIDWCHMTGHGYELVARRIYDQIKPDLVAISNQIE